MVSEITLVPGGGGVFDVDVTVAESDAPQRIYSKHETGRQAEPGEVLATLDTVLPAGTLRYGT